MCVASVKSCARVRSFGISPYELLLQAHYALRCIIDWCVGRYFPGALHVRVTALAGFKRCIFKFGKWRKGKTRVGRISVCHFQWFDCRNVSDHSTTGFPETKTAWL